MEGTRAEADDGRVQESHGLLTPITAHLISNSQRGDPARSSASRTMHVDVVYLVPDLYSISAGLSPSAVFQTW